jgi:hypothetical protein
MGRGLVARFYWRFGVVQRRRFGSMGIESICIWEWAGKFWRGDTAYFSQRSSAQRDDEGAVR